MNRPIAFGALLLASTLMTAPAALAQATPPAIDGPAAEAAIEGTAAEVASEGTAAEADPAAPEAAPPPVVDPDAEVEVSAPGVSGDADEIVVIGRNIPNVVRATPQVISVLSSADIERSGDGDIAGALNRVTGLSVVGSGFVYVRGLGDRYSSSLLNGSPLPSPEPLRRVVPLDIFPTNIVASALVQKSYSANYPGEFGGGVVNLTTRAVPTETSFDIGLSLGWDSETTGRLGYTYYGSKTDWLGYDEGERRVPAAIRNAGTTGTSLGSAQILDLSNAATTLLQRNRDIPPSLSGNFSFGTAKDVGDNRIGMIASGGIDNGWRTRDAAQQATDDVQGSAQRDFRTVLTDNRILVNGLLGFGAEFGEHRVRIANVYIHDTLKQGRLGAGTTGNLPAVGDRPSVIEQNTNFFERELFTTQGTGEFEFGDFSLDLRGSYAKTQRNSPYERSFTYTFDAAVNDYVNSLSGNQSATVAFSELDERLWSGAADVAYKFGAVTLSGGYAYSDTTRDSSRFTFRYIGPNAAPLPSAVAQLRPDFLLSDFTIQQFGIALQNTSTAQGAAQYDAGLRIHAGYGQLEATISDGLRATLGVRYEDAVETITPSGTALGTRLANDYFLPAATVTWNFAENMQLRLHGSKTLARPQFRELAPQLYQDFESDRQFIGNPLLVDSQLYNAEARYEWFFDRDQRFSVAGFYKRIDDPVEAIATFTSDGRLQTGFSNAPRAELYGAEFELQKYIPLDGVTAKLAAYRAVVIANYSYTKSSISAGTEQVPDPIQSTATPRFQQANLLFADGAAMVGQSDHLVNFQIGIENEEELSQLTLLANYASPRITTRGPINAGQRLPDLVEKPGVRLDLVGRQGITLRGRELELKIEARNLLGTRYSETQDFGDRIIAINRYDMGRTVSIGLSAKF
jgi:outer membrane receptor protein involved in Fe transport